VRVGVPGVISISASIAFAACWLGLALRTNLTQHSKHRS
jgi:hypothetical protein